MKQLLVAPSLQMLWNELLIPVENALVPVELDHWTPVEFASWTPSRASALDTKRDKPKQFSSAEFCPHLFTAKLSRIAIALASSRNHGYLCSSTSR